MTLPLVEITEHAIDRWIERVECVHRCDARAAMLKHERVIRIAADFGAHFVKVRPRVRLVLRGLSVVTVFGEFEPITACPPGTFR